MFERLEKMDRRAIVALVVAIGVGLLIFGGIASGIRQAGWNEGFLVGLLSNSGAVEGGQAVNPYLAVRGYGMHGWGWHPFWFIGGFFRFLFFGFLVMIFLKFIGCRRWARHGGYPRGPWGQHQGGQHHWHGGQQQSQQGEGAQSQSSATAPDGDPLPGGPRSGGPQGQPTSWTQV